MKSHVFPCGHRTLRGATCIEPTKIVHRVLKINPIKLTITQEHDFCACWDQLAHQLHQLDVKSFWSMTLGTLAHYPGQRQGTTLIDDVNHQRTTAPTDAATIHNQHQRL